jgi:hypothetical protein
MPVPEQRGFDGPEPGGCPELGPAGGRVPQTARKFWHAQLVPNKRGDQAWTLGDHGGRDLSKQEHPQWVRWKSPDVCGRSAGAWSALSRRKQGFDSPRERQLFPLSK